MWNNVVDAFWACWSAIGSIVLLVVGLVLLVRGMYLVYTYDINEEYEEETDEPDGHGGTVHVKIMKTRPDPVGRRKTAFGILWLLLSVVILWPLAVNNSWHAQIRSLYGLKEGQYNVSTRLKNVEVDPNNKNKITWKKPTDTTTQWIGVNVTVVPGYNKPNTEVLPGTSTEFEAPEGWDTVEVWYGTSLGPSSPVVVKNLSLLSPKGGPVETGPKTPEEKPVPKPEEPEGPTL